MKTAAYLKGNPGEIHVKEKPSVIVSLANKASVNGKDGFVVLTGMDGSE